MMKDLNHIYKDNAPFWEIDHYHTGFEWIWFDDADNSIVSFIRKDDHGNEILCVFNFTPVAPTWATAAKSRPNRFRGRTALKA